MAKVLVNESSLTGIANAIRSKNGTSDTYKPSEMAAAIEAIESGGGVVEPEEKDVNFYDYDGTRLYSYTLAEAQALTALPTPPEHEGLTFQEWNWTLEDIKTLDHECDIGANYDTFDGATRLYVDIKYPMGTQDFSIELNKSGSGSINIDWGDGSALESVSPTFNTVYPHKYDIGQYVITLTTSSPSVFILISRHIINQQSSQRYITLKKIELGSNIKPEDVSYPYFDNMYNLETVTVPKHITAFPSGCFSNCLKLKYIVIPNGTTTIAERFVYNCINLNGISLPKTVSNIVASSIFMSCTNLKTLCIPDACTWIYYDVFNECLNLKKLILPSSMEKVNNRAFDYCYSLEVVKFRSQNAYTIPHGAFNWSYSIAEYYFYATTPPTLESSESLNCSYHTKIYVPAGCGEAYKTATNWTTYADKIVEMEA